MFALEDKRVVITGARGGVGAVLVRHFADLGARVVACDLPGTSFDDLPVAEVCLFDLTDSEATRQSAEQLCEQGAPDVVISNAGWTRAENLEQLTPEALDHELDLNYRGAAHLTHALLPALRRNSGGASLIFISSVNSLAHFGNPSYSAAKGALNAWMRAIAAEEGQHGIRANVITPGSIRTQAWDHRIEKDPNIVRVVASFYPLGRLIEPQEVANAAAFLASPLSSGITGVTLPVDAGLTASFLPFVQQLG